MAAVTVSITRYKKIEDNREIVNASLNFGDGTTSYPAGGILVAGKTLGLVRYIDSLDFVGGDAASTRTYKWDSVNQKIRIYVETAGTYAEMTGVIPTITGVLIQAIGSK